MRLDRGVRPLVSVALLSSLVLAERRVIRGAIIDPAGSPAPDLGTLRGSTTEVQMDDGTWLHVEVDEPDPTADHLTDDDVTVVFTHGYCLSLDCWHYQRAALRGRVRMVFWDQRGHGRSDCGPAESAAIERMGKDLRSILDAVVPTGRVVLVGHSMGGMTIMAFSAAHPELIGDRVVAVALMATSSGGVLEEDLGLGRLGQVLAQNLVFALTVAARRAELTQRLRDSGSLTKRWMVHHWSFAGPVSPELLDFTSRMVAITPIDVAARLTSQFTVAQEFWALNSLSHVPMVILTGDRDHLIPAHHSERLFAALPHARLEVVRDANHLLMLERPEVVTRHLVQLLRQTAAHDGGTSGG